MTTKPVTLSLALQWLLALTASAATATYDADGRLTRVTYADASTIEYPRDSNGNQLDRIASRPVELTLAVDPPDSGTVTGAGRYFRNTQQSLTATAGSDFVFDSWKRADGTVLSTSPSYTHIVTAAETLIAQFRLPSPEVVIEDSSSLPATNLVDGTSVLSFGSYSQQAAAAKILTIRNVGTTPLASLGGLVEGPASLDFTISALPISVAPGASTELTIQFIPSAVGSRNAMLRVTSNDSDENPFDIELTGSGLPGVNFATGMKGYWAFNRASGADMTGQGFNAILTGVTGTEDRLGVSLNALKFNGTSDSIEIAPSFPMTNQHTVSAWIKPAEFGSIRPIIEKASPGWGGEVDYEFFLQADGRPYWAIVTDDGGTGVFCTATSSLSVPVSEWTHVAGVIDKESDQVILYINGVQQATASMGGRSVRNRDRPFRIGARVGNQAKHFFSGAIDDVRVYDRALSSGEISLLYALAEPQIAIEDPAGSVMEAGAQAFVGAAPVGRSATTQFTIRNYGGKALENLVIAKDGPNSALFEVLTNPAPPIAGPIGSATFRVKFTPDAMGERNAQLHIHSNDHYQNPLLIHLTATGLTPVETFQQPVLLDFNNDSIPQGWTLDFQTGPGRNGGVQNGRFEAEQVDSYVDLIRDVSIPARATRLEMSGTVYVPANYWGAGALMILHNANGASGLASLGKKGYGENKLVAFAGLNDSPPHIYLTDLGTNYAVYHFKIAFESGLIHYRLKREGQNASSVDQTISIQGIGLHDTEKIKLRVFTTTGESTWMDNISIRALSPYQIWLENRYELDASNPSIAGDGADPDNDGISNLVHYSLGLDSLQDKHSGLPTADIMPTEEGDVWVFKYRRLIDAMGISYLVGISDNLTTWDWTQSQIVAIGQPVPTGDGKTEILSVRLKLSPLVTRKFMKLKIFRQP